MTAPAEPKLHTGLAGPLRLGAIAGVLLLGTLVAWAAVTPIAGAVIAPGQAVVHGKPKQVQSLDGGIVADIAVKEGDRVRAGELLLRLDPTLLQVGLDISRARLGEALARRARLEAEQIGAPRADFTYPALPFPRPDTAKAEAGQHQILATRAELLEGDAARLEERRLQIASQREGIAAQAAAKREQLSYIDAELKKMTDLEARGLARGSEVMELRRGRAEMLGHIADLEAQDAQLTNTLRDAEIEALQRRREFREEVATDLRATTAEIEELIPQILTMMTQLDRVEIRAPADGVVHEMTATTLGGVIAPGASILQVVPVGDGLDFELRLDPRWVDQVHPGQAAEVILAAFDPREVPRLKGTVGAVSPGTLTDRVTGQVYYRVAIHVPPSELARLGDATLVPGMPVEAFLETGDRTVMRYLLKPLSAQLSRAFRES